MTKTMSVYMRIEDEYLSLRLKIERLESILRTRPGNISDNHYKLLEMQVDAMKAYLVALGHRLADLKETYPDELGKHD